MKVVVSNHDFEKTPPQEEIITTASEDAGTGCGSSKNRSHAAV